jgi:hypothetical protein
MAKFLCAVTKMIFGFSSSDPIILIIIVSKGMRAAGQKRSNCCLTSIKTYTAFETIIPELKQLDPTRIWDAGYMTSSQMGNDEMDEPHPKNS